MTSEPLNQYTDICEGDDERKWAAVFHGKELMASTYIAKLIFDKCRNMPNRKLISHTIKELFGWQRKAALPLSPQK